MSTVFMILQHKVYLTRLHAVIYLRIELDAFL